MYHVLTLRRFLTDKAKVLLPRFKSAHNSLRSHFLKPHSSYWLDFDSTAKTLYGHQEGVVKGYNPGKKGKKSYHPLICTEAHSQDCLGGELRHGNAYTADGVEEMLEQALAIIPPEQQRLRVRADAGFYNGNFIANLSQNNIGFTIVAKMTQAIRCKLTGLRYSKVNALESTAKFKYKPSAWKQPYQFIVLREKLTEERKEQLKLFTVDKYAYHAIVTNLPLTPYKLFNFYGDRTGIERIIRTLKEDYPYATAPTNNFTANALYAELSLLAYNIVIWFRRLCLPDSWQTFTIGTLRHRLLLIPGVFTRGNNRPVLKLPRNNPYQDVFKNAQKQIDKLTSLV